MGGTKDMDKAHDEAANALLSAMAEKMGGALGGMPEAGGNLSAVRGEDQFGRTLWEKGKNGALVVVKYGAAWCKHCPMMLPEFGAAARRHPEAHFVLADVDTLPETGKDIRFTPTFSFYRGGVKLDEITRTSPQQLRDHVWMHAPDKPYVPDDA